VQQQRELKVSNLQCFVTLNDGNYKSIGRPRGMPLVTCVGSNSIIKCWILSETSTARHKPKHFWQRRVASSSGVGDAKSLGVIPLVFGCNLHRGPVRKCPPARNAVGHTQVTTSSGGKACEPKATSSVNLRRKTRTHRTALRSGQPSAAPAAHSAV
jgi:hypothetical protein